MDPSTTLAGHAERHRLARLLEVPPDQLDFLRDQDPAHLAALRERLADVVHDHTEERLHRIVAASRLVPLGLAGSIAERAVSARLSARISAVMEPDRAAAFIHHVTPDYVAAVGAHADPAAIGHIVPDLPDDKVVAAGSALAEQGDMVAIGRLIGLLSDGAVRAIIERITDAADLLHALLLLEDPNDVGRLAALIDDERLRGAASAAWQEPELATCFVELLAHGDGDLRARVADLVAELPDFRRLAE